MSATPIVTLATFSFMSFCRDGIYSSFILEEEKGKGDVVKLLTKSFAARHQKHHLILLQGGIDNRSFIRNAGQQPQYKHVSLSTFFIFEFFKNSKMKMGFWAFLGFLRHAMSFLIPVTIFSRVIFSIVSF